MFYGLYALISELYHITIVICGTPHAMEKELRSSDHIYKGSKRGSRQNVSACSGQCPCDLLG